MDRLEGLTTAIAALLLLKEGEITLKDIEALPFVEGPARAAAIAMRLARAFEVERYQRKRSRAGIAYWEDVIQLRGPAVVPLTHAGRERG